jgi:replicative DNA helicase
MSSFANPEAERVLLASALEYSEAYHQAVALGLSAADFVEDGNRSIFQAMAELGEAGNPVNYESVISALVAGRKAEQFTAVLSDLTNPLHVARKNVEWHVQQLKEKSRRRRLKLACERAILAVEDPTETTDACFGYLSDSLLEIETGFQSGEAQRVNDFMPQLLQDLEHRSKVKGLVGLPTGISQVDEFTTGVRMGELWVLGALSGRGKSALGAQIALANATTGTAAVIFSLEMTRDELGGRFLSNESRVPASKIRNPRWMRNEDWAAMVNCVSHMENWPLYVDDAPSLTIGALTARARLYIRRHGVKLIVVDYLRLVQAPGKELRERLGNATDALRQLAKSEKVAVVALSQLRRPEGGINSRPTMLDLKESGDIEAHAHVVLLIYMPIESDAPTGRDEILIGKNRHGPMGSIEVTFSRERLKFLPRESRTEEEPQWAAS